MTKKRQKNGKSDENHDLDINQDVDKQLDESIDVADENQEINELKDKLLRSRAELENFKKRHETEDEHHDHMICVDTGAVNEFSDELIEERQKLIAEKYGYELVDHTMVLYVKPISKK